MSVVAILGAGPVGGAIAHALARRARFRDIRLVDAAGQVAAGKALDIQQSGPIEHFDTRLSGSADVLAATGAAVVILADTVGEGEWEGERGLGLVRQLARAGLDAPIVFAGAKQTWLMEASARELKVPVDRLAGTAAAAVVGAARALVAIEANGSSADVSLTVTGRPPGFVIAWSTATIAGAPVADRVPAHRLLAVEQALARLWPPGPQAIGAVTARVAEGLAFGSRQLHQALVVLDGEFGVRGVAAMLPLELGNGRILKRVVPTLSPQERTRTGNLA
jgi:malate dehydrogenase